MIVSPLKVYVVEVGPWRMESAQATQAELENYEHEFRGELDALVRHYVAAEPDDEWVRTSVREPTPDELERWGDE